VSDGGVGLLWQASGASAAGSGAQPWALVLPVLKAFPRFADWQVEKVAIATSLLSEAHQAIETAGFLPQSLADLTEGLQA